MPLYVEYAPMGLAPDAEPEVEEEDEDMEDPEKEEPNDEKTKKQRTIFVKNLNFDTN
jgi:hypothetical protein